MRTTALLTLTGTGTVIREWIDQLAAGNVATYELLLLGSAVVGLGLLTLFSHRTAQSNLEVAEPTLASIEAGEIDASPAPSMTMARSRA